MHGHCPQLATTVEQAARMHAYGCTSHFTTSCVRSLNTSQGPPNEWPLGLGGGAAARSRRAPPPGGPTQQGAHPGPGCATCAPPTCGPTQQVAPRSPGCAPAWWHGSARVLAHQGTVPKAQGALIRLKRVGTDRQTGMLLCSLLLLLRWPLLSPVTGRRYRATRRQAGLSPPRAHSFFSSSCFSAGAGRVLGAVLAPLF